MFYLMMHILIQLCGIRQVIKNHSDSKRVNSLPPLHGLLFLISSKIFYMHHSRQDNTYHGLYYTSHGALAGMRSSPMSPPCFLLLFWGFLFLFVFVFLKKNISQIKPLTLINDSLDFGYVNKFAIKPWYSAQTWLRGTLWPIIHRRQ